MPAKELPLVGQPLARGLSYTNYDPPDSDAAHVPPGANQTRIPGSRGAKLGTNQSPEKQVEVSSTATRKINAPGMGARLTSNLHTDGYLNYDVPHFEPGSSDE